jgi:hypothetical protein
MLQQLSKLFSRTRSESQFRLTSRDSFEFSAGERKVTVSIEREGATRGIAILKDSIRVWDSPNSGEPVSEADRVRIAKLLEDELKQDGHKCYID